MCNLSTDTFCAITQGPDSDLSACPPQCTRRQKRRDAQESPKRSRPSRTSGSVRRRTSTRCQRISPTRSADQSAYAIYASRIHGSSGVCLECVYVIANVAEAHVAHGNTCAPNEHRFEVVLCGSVTQRRSSLQVPALGPCNPMHHHR